MGRADSGVADSLVGPRVFTVHDTADVLGCLVYGNHRLTKKVEFMSHRNDLARASAEGDCSGLRPAALGGRRGASSAQKGPSPSFLVGGRISVPSNGEDVEGTLIRFVYQIGLIPDGPDYRMLLAYQAAPVSPEFHGDIRRLTVRPSLAAVRESLMRIGYGDGIIQLDDYEGGFTSPMKLPEQYIIEEQQYGFYDAKGNPVGAIYAPFLSPEAPR
jgi:hypothetical protein